MERAVMAPGTGVEAQCSTGNCTFTEEYGTVAFCSRCEDSSAELTVKTSCSPDSPGKSITEPGDCPENSLYISETSLPENFYPSNYAFIKMNVSYRVGNDGFYNSTAGAELFKMDVVWNQTEIEMANPRPDMTTVRIIAGKTPLSDAHRDTTSGRPISGCDSADKRNDWRCRGYGAATCTITPCVRTYNATVTSGRLAETVVSDSGTLQWGTQRRHSAYQLSSILDTRCITKDERHRLTGLGYAIDPTQRWLGFNASDVDVDEASNGTLATKALLRRKCLYTLPGSFMEQGLFDSVIGYMFGNVRGLGSKRLDNGVFVPDLFMGELIPKHVYNSGHLDMEHIENTFANISDSLTKYLRTHGSENWSAPAVGEAYYYSTCIEVRWVWIAFPSVLAMLTLVLLAFVVRMTHVQGKPVWKSSPLVWIHQSCGQGGGPLGGNGTGTPTLAELEEKSKQVPVSVN